MPIVAAIWAVSAHLPISVATSATPTAVLACIAWCRQDIFLTTLGSFSMIDGGIEDVAQCGDCWRVCWVLVDCNRSFVEAGGGVLG